ncbi:hypothetical protein CEP54_013837 [Fusarium duplospermum]|uniref:Monooxygenase n=1 Tax=Fusarium duplospermum TaxID=1325734 RepID=A0A428P0H6_9HYPO|nr:hypothetical protein CEP54_013837 [Fusarium duplospermum]
MQRNLLLILAAVSAAIAAPNPVPQASCSIQKVNQCISQKLGFDAKILERGDNFGGVWYWNCYPGARVGSEWPFYQFDIPEAYESWTFSERFPDHNELRCYIDQLDNVLNLRKHTIFNVKVIEAIFDAAAAQWTVCTAPGRRITSKYLILATGLLYKEYLPDLPGLATYKEIVEYSASYPLDLIL